MLVLNELRIEWNRVPKIASVFVTASLFLFSQLEKAERWLVYSGVPVIHNPLGWGSKDSRTLWLEALSDMAQNRSLWGTCCSFLPVFLWYLTSSHYFFTIIFSYCVADIYFDIPLCLYGFTKINCSIWFSPTELKFWTHSVYFG